MFNLARRKVLRPTVFEKQKLIQESLRIIFSRVDLARVILFGSALTDEFDEWSDLDFLIIFKSIDHLKANWRKLYRDHHQFPCRVDFVMMTLDEYERKSKIGGVAMIAREDGVHFDQTSHV